jgi:hypothetical protein
MGAIGETASGTTTCNPTLNPTRVRGLTWRQLTLRDWSGSWNGKLHGTITAEGDRWAAYLGLEVPPGGRGL